MRHQVPAALRAPLPLAVRAFLYAADELAAFREFDVLGLPQRERVDGTRRPGSARAAVAIAHRFRRTRHFERDGSAETAAHVFGGHVESPLWLIGRAKSSPHGPKLGLVQALRIANLD